jgi:hypothetical protein
VCVCVCVCVCVEGGLYAAAPSPPETALRLFIRGNEVMKIGKNDLRPVGVLRQLWEVVKLTDVSGEPISPIFIGEKECSSWTPRSVLRNVGNQRCVKCQRPTLPTT